MRDLQKQPAFYKKSCATLLKKRLWHRYFPVNFVKFLRKPFLRNTSGRLLLYFTICYLFLNSIKVLIRFWSIFKGATKLHFTYYLWVWSLLFFNISVSKLAFPTNYFGNLVFRFCVLDEFSVYSEIWILYHIYEIIRFRIIEFIFIIVYMSTIWPSVILFLLYKNSFSL